MIGLILCLMALFLYYKGNKPLSLTLFYILAFRGMGIIPFASNGIKTPDLAIVYMVIICIMAAITHKEGFYRKDNLSQYLIWLGAFLLLSSLVSFLYYGFTIIQIITVVRGYLYILSYFIFRDLTIKQQKKLFSYLGFITFISCLVYLLQIPLRRPLLLTIGEFDSDQGDRYGGLLRFTNIPPLRTLFFFLSFFAFSFYDQRIKAKYQKLIYSLSILLSFGRTAIITSFGILIAALSLRKKKNMVWIILACVLCYPLISFLSDTMNKRDSSLDVEMISKGEYKNYTTGHKAETTTMTYRFAWVYERWEYIKQRPLIEQLFGLGFISEEDPEALKRYRFRVIDYGAESDTFQLIYSADIAFGNLITRWGLLGSLILFSVWFHLLAFFWKNRKNNLAYAALAFWLYTFMGNFSSRAMSETNTMINFFAIYAYLNLLNNKGNETLNYNRNLQ